MTIATLKASPTALAAAKRTLRQNTILGIERVAADHPEFAAELMLWKEDMEKISEGGVAGLANCILRDLIAIEEGRFVLEEI